MEGNGPSGKKRTFRQTVHEVAHDQVLRTFLSASFSLLLTVAIMGYHVFLAVAYRTAWSWGIAVYYAALIAIRAYVLFTERRLYREKPAAERLAEVRRNIYLVCSILLFAIDFALIVPIAMMVRQEREVSYTKIPAIATAAYTVYRVIAASVTFFKSRHHDHLSFRIFKDIGFIEMHVAVLSMQYILIMTFSEDGGKSMETLSAITSFAIWLSLLAVSVVSLARAAILKRKARTDRE